jgi:hypothetical protein
MVADHRAVVVNLQSYQLQEKIEDKKKQPTALRRRTAILGSTVLIGWLICHSGVDGMQCQ